MVICKFSLSLMIFKLLFTQAAGETPTLPEAAH